MRFIHASCRVLGLLLVLAAPQLGAQEIAGTWRGQVDADYRRVGDSRLLVRRDSLTLRIQAVGDSLTGFWEQGSTRVPIHGKVEGSSLHFSAVAEPKAMWHNGQRVLGPVELRWSGALVDGQLRGSFWTIPGDSINTFNWELRKA